ncbi:Metallo-dependent phosphatase, partial [Trametes versicolor FP-101664 SS1]|uniref:Metallo-dependent phosphatase n=1 Tax=Trametes versicolor (strain FP-101664) TaxID=717944 RepID=UPI0004622DE1
RRKRDDPVIRVVCISDTHNSHHRLPPLPEGDILIHAGDLTNAGSAPELHNALLWLDGQPHPHKVFIAGNHDAALAESSARDYVRANFPNLIYLQDESVRLKLRDRWHVRVHGTPHTPGRGERGVFQYERGGGYPKVRAIPIRTDILVTHGPPQFHLDAAGAGCNSLRSELWRVRPLLHVFGHIHAGRGVEYTRWSSVTTWYEGVCKGRVG